MFSEAERDAALARAIELLAADRRVEAAVVSGSIARGEADRWSDFDLVAVLVEGARGEELARDWDVLAYREWPVVHHYATEFGTTLVRGFLFENGLLADLAFTPVGDFQAWAPLRVAFDRCGVVTRVVEAWQPYIPTPDWRGEAGFAAHDVLHACVAAVRGRPWQSVYYLQRIRNRTLSLASERHGWDPAEFVFVDDLPAEEIGGLLPTLVGDLEPSSLIDAVDAATRAFLAELRQGDRELADRLGPTLLAIVSAAASG
jgi:predicted nucleotidyltransferase